MEDMASPVPNTDRRSARKRPAKDIFRISLDLCMVSVPFMLLFPSMTTKQSDTPPIGPARPGGVVDLKTRLPLSPERRRDMAVVHKALYDPGAHAAQLRNEGLL